MESSQHETGSGSSSLENGSQLERVERAPLRKPLLSSSVSPDPNSLRTLAAKEVGVRGRGRTQVSFVPRALQVKHENPKGEETNTSNSNGAPKPKNKTKTQNKKKKYNCTPEIIRIFWFS